ncbi:MAG: sigma-70 family RNA polymerase sigma factor [Planctomycetota bacterium]
MTDPPAPGPHGFTTTRWSLVAAARPDEASRTRARAALEDLCRAYWYPLYAFVRYRGHGSQEAQDLTQSFFARVIEKDGFASADPGRGRFRTYLLGAMKHFLANEWHRARAQKRGGEVRFVELGALEPDALDALEPARPADPDAGFDREWALRSTARALERLREESERAGQEERFEALKGCLTGAEPDRSETAARLGLTAGALKVAVHRLRQRYRELLRAEIAQTVADPSDVEDEMRHLVDALRGETGTRL